MGPSVLWFRRDLRLTDHPALLAAVDDGRDAGGDGTVPVFVLDPALWDAAGLPRRAWLVRSLRALDRDLGGRLVVLHGDPVDVLPRLARAVGAARVHASADAGPYGRRRDAAVSAALQADGRHLERTGTPYAVGPGTLRGSSGEPFRVFGAFRRAWLRHGWPAPAPPAPPASEWAAEWAAEPWAAGGPRSPRLPPEPDLGALALPEAGERTARERWEAFLAGPVAGYAQQRDLPAAAATSVMSAHLKFGEVHPRTLLADLAAARAQGRSVEAFTSELCWREFYADVLWHRPETAREYLRPEFARMRYDDPATQQPAAARLRAWQDGRTGFPFVDAGMRQLRAEGWVHNRVRMVVASFLVKDLHVDWRHGARYFMRWLRDGDLASNNHGWQWVAGSGTDAAPYFRIFNPVTQGRRFDPDGVYVRRYVPELAHLPGAAAHTPWDTPDGYARGYPERIVDHAAERAEALARYVEIKAGTGRS